MKRSLSIFLLISLFFLKTTTVYSEQSPDPKADALLNEAEQLKSQGYWNKSKDKYKEALELNPDLDQALFGLGLIAEFENDLNLADDYFRSVIQKSPNHADSFFHLGAIAYSQKKTAMACRYFKQAVDNDPKMIAGFYNLGLSYAELGEFEEARESFKKAISLDPGNARAFYQIARTYEIQGFAHEARLGYQEALKLNPDFQEARDSLSKISESSHEEDSGINDLRRRAQRQIPLFGGSFGSNGLQPTTGLDSFRGLTGAPAQSANNKAMLFQLGSQLVQEFLNSRQQQS